MARITFNARRCTGCKACEMACRQEHNLPVGVKWRVVTETLQGDYPHLKKIYNSTACRHCSRPGCVAACPAMALAKANNTGMVELYEDLCTGCKACVEACSFKAMAFNNRSGKAGKCNLCAHRLESGFLPACVQTCMGIALTFE